MKRFFSLFIPPKAWQKPVVILIGVFVGLLIYTTHISNAFSYLSDSPKTCVNCHIMTPQYATWYHSSHREVTNCNDCHVPHDNVFNKYYFKAKDGIRHATIFTLKQEPQTIYILEPGKAVVQENCKRCHEYQNENIKTIDVTLTSSNHGEGKLCWDCHREVPHGRVNSLSAVPNARVPKLEDPVPKWIYKLINNN